jgi:hypothetical protein
VGEVLGGEDRVAALGRLGDPDGDDRRQAGRLEVQQDVVLTPPDIERQLLQGVEGAVGDQEANEVTGRPDRQLAKREPVRGPRGERLLPRQVDEGDRRIAKPEAGECRRALGGRGRPQRRLRR